MIWFTSDLHLGHEAVIKMQDRPFADVREMDDALIHNINECVGGNDAFSYALMAEGNCRLSDAARTYTFGTGVQ